jgi:hypothetical protein
MIWEREDGGERAGGNDECGMMNDECPWPLIHNSSFIIHH